MYRPTVRMDDRFREWVDSAANATTLDRNQVMRLSLFVAAHSKQLKMILENYLKPNHKSLPSPDWEPMEHGLWLNQSYQRERGVTSHAIDASDVEIVDERSGKRVIRANTSGIIKWSL